MPDGLKYVGSESCVSETCHPTNHMYEYAIWKRQSPHSQAYATLEKVGSQYDPECIVCHVIGYDYDSGFVSAEKTPQLENVGCEYCHGPGSEHNKNPFENKMKTITDKISLCLTCHKPEHSGDFAGHEEEKLQKIKHWEEPNDVSNVK